MSVSGRQMRGERRGEVCWVAAPLCSPPPPPPPPPPAVLPPPHPSLPHRVQVGMSFSSHVLAIVPAAVIGVFSGLLATAFTLLNLKVARLRDALTSHLK